MSDGSWGYVFRGQYRNFANAILQRREPFVSGHEGRRAVALIEDSMRRAGFLSIRGYFHTICRVSPGWYFQMSAEPNTFSSRKVLVTGGTGFIRGRLVEKLILDRDVQVRVLVRDFSKAWRLARLSADLIQGDITDAGQVKKAVEGCDSIVNCAYGTTGTPEAKHSVNVQGTRNLLEAAVEFGVGRMVHLSTVMVYGDPFDGDLDESAKSVPYGNFYADSKLESEEATLDYAEKRDLSAVVLQPTVVYGPFAPTWTINVLRSLKAGRTILVNGGDGGCNTAYVDDLANAILLTLDRKEVRGRGIYHFRKRARHMERILRAPRGHAWLFRYCKHAGRRGAAYQQPQRQRTRSVVTETVALLRENSLLRERILGTREFTALRRMARFVTPAPVRQSIRGRFVGHHNGGKPAETSVGFEACISADALHGFDVCGENAGPDR